MRKADLIHNISEKTGIPRLDVLVSIETMLKEVKESLAKGENIVLLPKKELLKLEETSRKTLQYKFLHILFLHSNLQKNLCMK